MKALLCASVILAMASCAHRQQPIDREALLRRNNPHITQFDPLSSLSVGNGEIAFTVDVTGLQTFHDLCEEGVPLGTQSQWGWHSFDNPQGYRHEETLRAYNFGRGKAEPYAVQSFETTRQRQAADWLRSNPHRMHLGVTGFDLPENTGVEHLSEINQTLDLRQGVIRSSYKINGAAYSVETSCHPQRDMLAARIASGERCAVKFHFPYPTGRHTDDACDWTATDKHSTVLISGHSNSATLKRIVDETIYYVNISWEGEASLTEKESNYFVLIPHQDEWSFTCSFSSEEPSGDAITASEAIQAAADHWTAFWTEGAAVDFSQCTDPRAKELERRVVLSQYLLAIQCAGSTPPQETGLTFNSWFGKFHLEMIWWHQAHWALWNRVHLLEPSLRWYETAEEAARQIARRQSFEGIRWMKMTDPGAMEAPSDIGSFLAWQQPHYIYLAELIWRTRPESSTLQQYSRLVEETAKFIYSFATYHPSEDRYVLKGLIPAQETLPPALTVNPPLELAYWHFSLETAQKWRERNGLERLPEWDDMLAKLSPLAHTSDSLYLAAETAIDTYENIRYTSDHPAVLGAVGILPLSRLINEDIMKQTLDWTLDNWNWDTSWGWDYPMTAMCAARLGEPDKAVDALMMEKRKNTYLPNGHNYQNDQLRIYLPGNGGLLTAIAMMCAGWDGCTLPNPGFPRNGQWNVKWEGLAPLP